MGIYRDIIKNNIFQNTNVSCYFIYCLLKANNNPQRIIWNKQEMIVEPGSFITGRKEASKETGLSQQNIRTTQETLINLKLIEKSTTKSTSKFTYLTVCNYKEYKINETLQQLTNHQLTVPTVLARIVSVSGGLCFFGDSYALV